MEARRKKREKRRRRRRKREKRRRLTMMKRKKKWTPSTELKAGLQMSAKSLSKQLNQFKKSLRILLLLRIWSLCSQSTSFKRTNEVDKAATVSSSFWKKSKIN